MRPWLELSAGLTPTCCSTLQYLQGAAYIAIVLAVFGVPQLLTYYFDRRDRRRERREDHAEAERVRREDRAEAERRHHEMMTALIAVLERNGHASSGQSELIERLRRRIAELEAEVALLRNGNGGNPTHGSARE